MVDWKFLHYKAINLCTGLSNVQIELSSSKNNKRLGLLQPASIPFYAFRGQTESEWRGTKKRIGEQRIMLGECTVDYKLKDFKFDTD